MKGSTLGLVITDGGRAAAGFTGKIQPGDCVARAIAIGTGLPYRQVYDDLAQLSVDRGGKRSARDGVHKKVFGPYLEMLQWDWTPTMSIGSGCRVRLRPDELPGGRLILSLSRHLCAVIDGIVYDTDDPRRDGTRCVYGYWSPGEHAANPQDSNSDSPQF